MPVTGAPRNYFKKFKFVVEIDGVKFAGFQSCSELSAEVAVVEQWEGGALAAEKQPGRVTFSDITLERGATQDADLFAWFKEVANIAANSGVVLPKHERTADIVQQDRDGTALLRWRLKRGWPNKFVAGEWDNNADENVIESVTLCYHDFDRVAV